MAGLSAKAKDPRRLAWGSGWALFGLTFALATLFVVWRALAAVDFAYPVVYDAMDLGATIERYGPQNDVRPGFHRTDRAERERLFSAIVDAIRDGGAGLADLTYHSPQGRALGPLLTPAEIRHLEDVAALVTAFERAGWIALVVTGALAGVAAYARRCPPPPRYFAVGAGGLLGLVCASVLAMGPKDVFYWLHERIFPPQHQWFFYYEESLMSMMMRAPDLFGAIALIWVALALPLGTLAFWGLHRILTRRATEGAR